MTRLASLSADYSRATVIKGRALQSELFVSVPFALPGSLLD